MAIARGWTGSATTASAVSSLSVDITGATDNEWVFCFLALRTNEASVSMTGWATAIPLVTNLGNLSHVVFARQKVTGDTTFSITWSANATQGVAILQQYTGCDPTTGYEVGATPTTKYTAAAGVFTTPTDTPADSGYWAVGAYSAMSGTSSQKTATWSMSGDMTTTAITGVNTLGTLVWANNAIADSNGAVTVATHSGTATTTNSAYGVGAASIFFLVPAASPQAPFQGVRTLQAVNRAAVI